MATADHAAPAPVGGILAWVTTTDHKRIGILYLFTSLAFFAVGGIMALFMRAELYSPDLQVVDRSMYSQLFTMHGTIMMLFFIVPFGIGLANYLVPLHIGAADVAFPRVNALTYLLFLAGGVIVFSGVFTSHGAASFGWTGFVPLSYSKYTL